MTFSTDYLPLIISAGFFLIFLLTILAIALFFRSSKKKQTLIKKIRSEKETFTESSKAEENGGQFKSNVMNFLMSLGQKISSKAKAEDYSDLRPAFLKAGIRRRNAPAIFWGVKAILAIFFPACIFLIKFVGPDIVFPAKKMIVLLCVLAILGFYLPNLLLRLKIKKRKEIILKGFPDALDLMEVCVQAGMGLDSAITRVANELQMSNQILSDELRIYNLEMRHGKLRKDALNNLAMRTDVEEVKNLVTLLIQTDKFGTSIGQALKVYSDTMRTQRFQRAEEMASKIPTKLLFPLILFIFPALFVVILGPALISIARAFKGL